MSATKPEAATLTDVLAAHEPVLGWFGGLTGIVGCSCLSARDYRAAGHKAGQQGYRAHVAVEVSRWLRTALLGDDAIEAAAEAAFALECGEYSDDAHPDHNRWTWRGDGHSDTFKSHYRDQARAALTAALDRVEALNTEEAGRG